MTEHNKLDQLRIEFEALTRESKRAKEIYDLLERQRLDAERDYTDRLDAERSWAKKTHDARVEYTRETQALRREPNSGDVFISNEILQDGYFREVSEKGGQND